MTLVEFLDLLKKRLWLVISLPVILALVVGLSSWLFLPNIYTTSVSLYVLTNTSDAEESVLSYNDFSVSQMVTNDVAELVNNGNIKAETAEALGLTSLNDYGVSVTSKTSTRIITISVSGESPEMVAVVANELARTTDNVARQVMNLKSVNVVSEAKIPTGPSGPPRLEYTLLALFAGLFVALFIIALMDLVSTKVRDADEVEKLLGVPAIGHFPIVER